MSQLTMFVMLGLLITPSALVEVWWQGLLIALVLVFVARPLAVIPFMKYFGFNRQETLLISWVGLRGSVPIILAIFPLMFGLDSAQLIFNVVFFVVLISATVQGSSLAWVARRLNLIQAAPKSPAATLEITTIADVDAEIVEYTLSENSRSVGRILSHMALPEGVVVAMIVRAEQVISPRGSTLLQPDDHVFIVLKNDAKSMVEQVFSDKGFRSKNPPTLLRLKAATKLTDINWCYDLDLTCSQSSATLEQLAAHHLGEQLQSKAEFCNNNITYRVEEMIGPRVITVSVMLPC